MAKISAVTGNKTSFGRLVTACIIRTVVAAIITLTIYGSFTIIATGVLTREIGYTVRYTDEDGDIIDVYTHYTDEGDDPLLDKYLNDESGGYFKVGIRSSLTCGQKTVVMILTQAVALIIWAAMIYSVMWSAGDSDALKQDFGGESYDKWRGIKAALVADIPYAVCYAIFVITDSLGILKVYSTVYKLLSYHLFTINELFVANGASLSVGRFLGAALVLLPLPIIAGVGYLLGQKHIVLKDKIMYKNK